MAVRAVFELLAALLLAAGAAALLLAAGAIMLTLDLTKQQGAHPNPLGVE